MSQDEVSNDHHYVSDEGSLESVLSVEAPLEGQLRVALPLPPMRLKHKGPLEERVYQ
jgi:hypothetical protein